jgi:predicted helicase
VINHVHDYYNAVCEARKLGNIESTYTQPITALLSRFGCIARDLSRERSRQAGENIDIKVWLEGAVITEIEPFAGVEVKKIGGIDKRARSQIKKEANLYGYAILTDNLSWEFWRAGEEKWYSAIQLIEEFPNGELSLKQESVELFVTLINDFFLQAPTKIKSSNKLAEYMAIHARTIRSVITGILKEDKDGLPLVSDRQESIPMFPELHGLFTRIKMDLRPLLNTRSFADMYAQTIVYGLFIARYNDASSKTFNRYEAIGKLKKESALLNRFFTHIASTEEHHPTLDSVVDKLCSLYQICDISALLNHEKHGDTIVHFYENFLAFYDPDLRKSLGVFYTPYQAVQYLVSMVDKLLIEDFGIEGGLSNNDQIQFAVPTDPYKKGKQTLDTKKITVPRVAILDPACGTGTFHAEIIKYIKNTYFSGAREPFYKDYILKENGLLSRIIGFEIMMTSYVVAHLKIRRTIYETLDNTPETLIPTSVYLTNTLTPPNTDVEQDGQMSLFDFSAAISDEAYKADTWKARRPIKVIIGNPPYLAASTTPFDISEYRTETDGETKLQERNSKLLGDDYVKFYRFAEQIINKNNEGILAFVSNNGFLDNPTFRGMRASLLRTFDKIYIVDLHGSANKQESTPNGGKDENIFNIMQGVSLFIGVKKTNDRTWAKVYHCDLWGKRERKFTSLIKGDMNFAELNLDPKMAYFIPFGDDDKNIYEKGIGITELFPVNVTGVKTGNDKAAILPTREKLTQRIDIVKNAIDETSISDIWGKFSGGQTAMKIQTDVLLGNGVVTPISFHPFDNRWTYYSGNSGGWIDRPREKKTMGHLLADSLSPIGENIGLVFCKTSRSFFLPFVSKNIVAMRLFSAMCETTYVAPLYKRVDVLGDEKWESNLDDSVLTKLTQHLSFSVTPLEVFDYIYGILHDPIYVERFDEYLCRDFPRVPIINAPQDNECENAFHVGEDMFREYVKAGERLRKLHLMQVKVSANLKLEPNTSDDLEIGAIKYKDGVLQLNANKCVHGIPEDVWNYRIGGYQVLDKWFKSHKGETMTIDSFDHIANVVGLLAETIKVQEVLRGLSGVDIEI